jgi:hypothetical protein
LEEDDIEGGDFEEDERGVSTYANQDFFGSIKSKEI